jgi:hypothetical protein
VHVAVREGLVSGALCAAAAGAAHLALSTYAKEAYASRAYVYPRRIAATVLILGGIWGGANAGYAKAVINWNGAAGE